MSVTKMESTTWLWSTWRARRWLTGQMVGHGAKFGRKKEGAIVALLSHPNIEAAARAVGIGTTTLTRWLQLPEFDTAYRNRAAHSQSIARLQQMSGAAVSVLAKIMLDPTAPASTRVRAADSVLDHAAKSIEIEDIEARLAALETGATSPATNRPVMRVIVEGLDDKPKP
jgi:hypothetical protein